MLSIILPANNEEGYIDACLESLLACDNPCGPVQIVVVANGCSDNTVGEARAQVPVFESRGWALEVLDLAEGGKIGALNAGDSVARYSLRLYLDADIRVAPTLLAELVRTLRTDTPSYASGSLHIPRARSWISDRYARFWLRLPFITDGVPGCGVFAVNGAGRARWGEFPQVISDDTFARYNFNDDERHKVPASFDWPITEGFANLVRVRRRQDTGLEEIRRLYPDLAARMTPTTPRLRRKLGLFFRDPIGFTVYSAVAVAVRLPVFKSETRWYRGRRAAAKHHRPSE
jgi:glycosyltransferase involved in cell wall biosynthesis